jgi:prepilin-type N-terminal cleavage/methylation domain-containing protein
MLIKIKSKNTGFTLLEVIVAIFILTVGIGGSFVLIQQTISTASIVQSRLIAAYLGQEGIEIIRNIRDNNWLEQRESPPLPVWNDGMSDCQGPTNCCEGDYGTDMPPSKTPLTTVVGCDFDNLRYLNIDSDGFYSYLFGTQTKFKRKILIEPIENNKMKVVVIIQWKQKSKTYEIEVVEHVTNWYEEHRQ